MLACKFGGGLTPYVSKGRYSGLQQNHDRIRMSKATRSVYVGAVDPGEASNTTTRIQ